MRQIEGQGTGEAGLAMLVRSELDLIGITGQVAAPPVSAVFRAH